jgi:molecular chaperone GrpE
MRDKDKNKDFPEETLAGGEDVAPSVPAEEVPPRVEEDAELAELKRRFMYLAAEFENYKKRSAREKEALISYGNERLLLQAVLPCLDNLERAMARAGVSGSAEALLAGVRLTYDQLLAELKKFGLEQMATEGEMFDPRFHEALAQVPWEGKPEGTILAEARKGYLLNGRLLRPAQVTVARRPSEAGPAESGPGEGDEEESGAGEH